MSLRYPRYSAPSDLDYEHGDGQPTTYAVECINCHQSMDVRADDRPPYRCDRCCQRDAEIQQRKEDARVA